MANTTENPNEQTIKCVVVGDNNVGKTRLICTRAYKQQYVTSRWRNCSGHVPTVWAIDQYRTNKEVLDNARCVIDGTTVSLRLWDTFGDHHKNRIFAYGKADVVIICFSICNENSLRHVIRFWYPEVRKHCKNIPIVLVGCKADLRFADLNQLNKTKSCLSRAILESDILFPDKCRNVAVELNCLYYETSVVLGYGVQEVFENVCRAALIYRKTSSFWNSRLKKISRPALQKPLQPPMPDPPKRNLENTSPLLLPNLAELFQHNRLTDITFICQEREMLAHKVVLGASSKFFLHIFLYIDDCESGTSLVEDCEISLPDNFSSTRISQSFQSKNVPYKEIDVNIVNMHFENNNFIDGLKNSTANEENKFTKSLISYRGKDNRGNAVYSVDLKLSVLRMLLDFCYTGSINFVDNNISFSRETMLELLDANQSFQIPYLDEFVSILLDERRERLDLSCQEFIKYRSKNMKNFLFDLRYFVDVEFQVDDGCVCGHKVLLSSGSDMMYAMFAGRFVESENKQVFLPNTISSSLQTVFEYIYTNTLGEIDFDKDDVCELITLANRFCLQNLIFYLENRVIDLFKRREEIYKKTTEVAAIKSLCEDAMILLKISKVHNAPFLSQWCLHFLTVHYNEACKHASKFFKLLPADSVRYLEEHRWPPVWFIKQLDCYDRAVMERIESESKKLKRY